MPIVTINTTDYHYEIHNLQQQQTIMLVHGHPFDGSMWNYQLAALKDFKLIIPDLKGYGKTNSAQTKITIEEHAVELNSLLDTLHIEQVHLIGLSMGGQIIVEFARLFPNKTLSLIVCDSLPYAETEASKNNRLALAERMEKIGMEEYTKQDIHLYIHTKTNTLKTSVYKHLYTMMIHSSLQGAVANHRGRVERRDNTDVLQSFTKPILFIVGEEDKFTPQIEIEKLSTALPHSHLQVITNAGHLTNMENAEEFNKTVLDFYNHHVSA